MYYCKAWGAINSNVFSHEIGHLLAGHHDLPDAGYTNIKHGYKITAINEGTVMASYSTLPNWSNPYVKYNGYPTGTLTWNYMAEVLRTEIPEKVHFYQPVNNIVLTYQDVVNLRVGDAISQNSIITSGNIVLPSNASLTMRSNETTLNAGFTVPLGAEVEIINESVIPCP